MSVPRITPVKHATYTHKIEWRVGEERRRLFFRSAAEAKAELARISPMVAKVGVMGLAMDARERDEYHAAKRLLQEAGHTLSLTEVVRRWTKDNPVGNGDMPWREAVTAFLTDKEKRGRSAMTLKNIKYRLEAFAETKAPLTVAEISTEAVEEWIHRRGVGGLTGRNDLAVMRAFCDWLKRKGKLAVNPCDRIETPHFESSLPRVLDIEESARVLAAAKAHGRFRYYAIAMLAGLRQSEIVALPDSAIRAEHIAVVGIGKKRGRTKRVVPVCPRLRSILQQTHGEPLTFSSVVHNRIKADAKVDWQPDILRHSWVSYRLALTGDAARTAMEAGHDPGTMARYYVDAKSRAEAKCYFGE